MQQLIKILNSINEINLVNNSIGEFSIQQSTKGKNNVIIWILDIGIIDYITHF